MPLLRARLRPALPALLAVVCFGGLATFGAPHVARADEVQITPEARARFSAGVNLLKDPEGPRYEEAYREFKAAYAASPSYKILGNLGLCAMKLERDEEAIDAYERYLKEGKDLDPAEVAQVKADLHTLKAGAVTIAITSNVPNVKLVDVRLPVRGERVMNVYGPIATTFKVGIRQGTHQLTAKADGYPDQTWEFDTSGASEMAHTFEFKKAAEAPIVTAPQTPTMQTVTVRSRPVPTGVYVGAAATGVFTVGAVVTGLLALGKHSDYDAKNNGTDATGAQSLKDSGETLNMVNTICVGGAIVAAGVTAVLFFTRPTVEEQRAASAFQPRDLRVAPMVGTNGGGLSFGGRF